MAKLILYIFIGVTLQSTALCLSSHLQVPYVLTTNEIPRIDASSTETIEPILTHGVEIRYYHYSICYGVLVETRNNSQIVITTADCVTDRSREGMSKTLEPHHVSAFAGGSELDKQHRSVYAIKRYPFWKAGDKSSEYNIAVIFLDHKFQPIDNIQPISWEDLKLTDKQLEFVNVVSHFTQEHQPTSHQKPDVSIDSTARKLPRKIVKRSPVEELQSYLSEVQPEKESEADFSAESRIAGGHIAYPKEIPWQVMLRSRTGLYRCGAGLAKTDSGHQIVLTAATCIEGGGDSGKMVPPYYWVLYAGLLNGSAESCYEQRREVVHIERHYEWFLPKPVQNKGRYLVVDIAILWTNEPFMENEFVKAMRLPPRKDFYPHFHASMLMGGWGAYEYNKDKERSDVLRAMTIQAYNRDDCARDYRYGIYSNHICGWHRPSMGLRGPCAGDFGSPIVADDRDGDGKLYMAGIFSWTTPGCLNHYRPAVFAGLSTHKDWIEEADARYRRGEAPTGDINVEG